MALALTLLLMLTLTGLVVLKRGTIGTLGFLQDAAYLHLAVARDLQSVPTYGAGGYSIPATVDVLWRWLLAACDWLCNDLRSAPYLVNAVLSALLLMTTLATARLLRARAAFTVLVALLLITSTSLPLDAVSGTSTTLAMLLVTWAWSRNLRSWAPGRSPLPLSAALLLGLAGLVRIEFLAIWLAFGLHGLLMCVQRGERSPGIAFVLIRVMAGAVVIGLVLAPALIWNTRVIGVPWPRFVGSPMTLDDWGSERAAPLALVFMGEAVREGYGWLHGAGFLQGWIARVCAWGGVAWVLVDAIRRVEHRPASALLAVVLVPVCFAPLYPFVGADAVGQLVSVLQPVWVLLASCAVWRLAELGRLALVRVWPASAAALQQAPLVLLAGLLVVGGTMRNARSTVSLGQQLAEAARQRAAVSELVAPMLPAGGATASDRVGWWLCERKGPVVDLTGAVTPEVLAYVKGPGEWDIPGLREFLRERDVQRLVIWSPAYEQLARDLGAQPHPGQAAAWPIVCALSPNAAP